MMIASIVSDIRFGIFDVLRGLGMSIVNTIYNTIDTLYEVAEKINSINFIDLLKDMDGSIFVKVFNAFFILSFTVLFLFSVWKITFKILDADSQETPLFEIVKEIVKCGVLIFCTYLLFNTSINIGVQFSKMVYDNFTTESSTIGDKMKTAYLTANEACFAESAGESKDESNVNGLKEQLEGYADVSNATTMEDFEKLVRNGTLDASIVSDSGSFSYRCEIYKKGFFNDGEDYAFNYNFLFGIVIGIIFLFAIAFAVIQLGRRQFEIVFLMTIAPLVFATSVCRKEQRSALYQQLASLVLQAAAMMILIGLTSIMFSAIQNSEVINEMSYFMKIVAQSILYIGCATLLLTGSTSLNRFIGENVSANSGRDMLTSMLGIGGSAIAAGGMVKDVLKTGKNVSSNLNQSRKGISQLARSGASQVKDTIVGAATSLSPGFSSFYGKREANKVNKGAANMTRGTMMQQSSNPFIRAYGRNLVAKGENKINDAASKWDFVNNKYNPEHLKNKMEESKANINAIKSGFGGTFDSIRNFGNPNHARYKNRPKVSGLSNESESI